MSNAAHDLTTAFRAEDGQNEVMVEPRAAALIESMRDIGYTLETALADIVDNSISAAASRVTVRVSPSGPLRIAIIDDGRGMSPEELIAAMRPGSSDPRAARAAGDLGRFGLGMKTASFSQCRRMTVVSRQGGRMAAAAWDLDRVAESDRWAVVMPEDPESIPHVDELIGDGTLVLWEQVDRVVDDPSTDAGRSEIDRRLDDAVRHLELVFHRFLAGESGLPKVEMDINGRALEPFDPFHSKHPATQRLPEDRIDVGGRPVVITAFTLPHHNKVSPAEWSRYEGVGGYVRNQGSTLR